MNNIILQDAFFIVVLVGLSIPIGIYIYKVMTGQKVFLTKIISPVEKCVYKIIGRCNVEGMGARQYIVAVMTFNTIGLISLCGLQMIQGFLPLNPEGMKGTSWHLAFNTVASFVSNTNWQAYSGESILSYLAQSIGLTVQNFVSAATGIAVLFALIRGFILKKEQKIGNYWVDITRITLYVLIPLSLVVALLIASQGVVQTFDHYKVVSKC
ncbi:potassium-transporting ATPase subunit KdpA [Neobacillus sp. CF12]|uniref:potassium-transporting ATPase subunit KdpA n=1 Tax=Neobacillus sp. CF12 TaxID=3055864 RepID=UPI0025A0F49E|nr:potassium-transporting ATPase subunit KdpA [Neobacillus sp. CF12]MDM5326740.1 potassium-transporting ATPase subunit KdpA [Neobacillus sp. CF12]